MSQFELRMDGVRARASCSSACRATHSRDYQSIADASVTGSALLDSPDLLPCSSTLQVIEFLASISEIL